MDPPPSSGPRPDATRAHAPERGSRAAAPGSSGRAPFAPPVEHPVSAELAAALVAEQFPALAPSTIEPLGEGWDNTAWLLDGETVFRFPRRAFAVPLLETEARVLPAVAPLLPLAVPVPTALGRPSERFPWPFAGYRRLPGRTACAARLGGDARRRAALPLGRFLRALHSVSAREAAELGAPFDELRRIDVPHRRGRALEALARARECGLLDDGRPWDPILEDAPDDFAPRRASLVHGDLYARHVLVDSGGAPAGVIDWGDLHAGEPALDHALGAGFLPPDAHDAFRAAAGADDGTAWRASRLRALQTALILLVYAHERGDADLGHEARTSLAHLR